MNDEPDFEMWKSYESGTDDDNCLIRNFMKNLSDDKKINQWEFLVPVRGVHHGVCRSICNL